MAEEHDVANRKSLVHRIEQIANLRIFPNKRALQIWKRNLTGFNLLKKFGNAA